MAWVVKGYQLGSHPLYTEQKNQNCRQPELNIASGQINWVISYHQYIARNRLAGEGEIKEGNTKMSFSKC